MMMIIIRAIRGEGPSSSNGRMASMLALMGLLLKSSFFRVEESRFGILVKRLP